MAKKPTIETLDQDTQLDPAVGRAPTATNAPAREYSVGYGRPPKSTQFRRGRSGNPKGRPKETTCRKPAMAQAALERKNSGRKRRQDAQRIGTASRL